MRFISVNSSSPHYAPVESLLISTFPENERRNLEQQRLYVDNNPRFTVYAALDAEKFVGFFAVWTFEEFSFVEHFAVLPEFRGKGYGTRILQYIKEIVKTPLLLEIEIPFSEEQVARQHFYEKNGFKKLDKFYFQPPYRAGEKRVVMHLMMYGKFNAAAWEECEEKLDLYIQKIYAEVYSFTHSAEEVEVDCELE